MLKALAMLALPRRARILDAGMGAGELGACIRGRFPDVELTGVDCWLRFLLDPECRGSEQWPVISCYDTVTGGDEADLTRFFERCTAGQYDAVVLGDVLEHLPQDRALPALERARAVAALGVVVNIPVSDFPQEPTWQNPLNKHLWWRTVDWWETQGAEHVGGDERSATFLFRSDVPPAPVLSIVVPTFNRRAFLDISLRALLRTVAPPWRYEVIVVDDGSIDGTREFIQREFSSRNVRCVRRTRNVGKPNNPGLARNVGIRAARGTWIAFMDSDIVHCSDIIHGTLTQANAPGLWKARGDWVMKRDENRATEIRVKAGRDEEMPGQFWWAADRELVVRLGGFDERFTDYGAEDQDLIARLLRCKLEVQHVRGQYAIGMYASRGLKATGGVLNKEQNDWQHEIRKRDKSVVRNNGVAWGEPHDS